MCCVFPKLLTACGNIGYLGKITVHSPVWLRSVTAASPAERENHATSRGEGFHAIFVGSDWLRFRESSRSPTTSSARTSASHNLPKPSAPTRRRRGSVASTGWPGHCESSENVASGPFVFPLPWGGRQLAHSASALSPLVREWASFRARRNRDRAETLGNEKRKSRPPRDSRNSFCALGPPSFSTCE